MYKILIGLFLSVLCLQAKCQMQFDEGSFSEVLAKAKQEKRMVFMDCYTSWCGPCKMLSPVLDELAAEYSDRARFCKVNVEDEPELSARFGIASIPTLIFFKNGEILKKTVGYREKDELEETLKELL